jgi:hypothetical protein
MRAVALPTKFQAISSISPTGLTPTQEMRTQMLSTYEIRTMQDADLPNAVMAQLDQAPDEKIGTTTMIAQKVIRLIQFSMVQELEQAHSDAEYVVE